MITNVLLQRKIRPIRNWFHWLKCYEAAETMEEIVGLLHCGFNVQFDQFDRSEPVYDVIDRIIFYFTIADGWSDQNLLQSSLDEYGDCYQVYDNKLDKLTTLKPEAIRRRIAEKAFSVLAANLSDLDLPTGLVIPNDQAASHNQWEKFISERLFPVIQSFFRVEFVCSSFTIHNLPFNRWPYEKNHQVKQITSFLRKLIEFIWLWKEINEPLKDSATQRGLLYYRTTIKRLKEAKPWSIEVLSVLGHLESLENRLLKLDQGCLKKLREIALRSELLSLKSPVYQDRQVVNLDEACYTGSPAAWILKKRDLTIHEGRRLARLRVVEETEK